MAREGESDFSQREIDGTLALLIDTQAWILRRIDRVHLIDTYTVRRTIHFEIELPDWALEAARQGDCRLILPLAVFGGGQALRNLEVTVGQDPAGTLTRHAGDTLTRLLNERLKKNGDLGIPEETRNFMSLLLGIDEEQSADEASGENSPAKNHANASQGQDRDTSVRTRATGSEAGNAVENKGPEKDNYILFVTSDKSISNNEASGSRFVIEVKTDQTIVSGLGNLDQQPGAIARALKALGLGRVSKLSRKNPGEEGAPKEARSRHFRFLAWWTKWKRRLWPTDTAFILAQSVSGFGDARSWQLEIYAPTELRITDGALIWWPTEPKTTPADNSHRPLRPTRRANTAVALTRFRVQADGVLDLGILIGIASLCLLTLAVLIGVLGRSESIIDAIVAVLVIAPSLGASIVTNPENHEMAGHYLRPYRRIIYLIGVASAVGAAFFILLGLAEGALQNEGKEEFFVLFRGIEVPNIWLAENEALASLLLWAHPILVPIIWDARLIGDNLELLGGGEFLLAGVSLTFMFITWFFLLFLIKELFKIRTDLDLRNDKSEKLFAIDGQDLELRPLIESTCLPRPFKGWRGSIWERSADFQSEHDAEKKDPFLSLSIDAIDIGPRAIFRLPRRIDLVPKYVEKTKKGEIEWLASRTDEAPYGNLDSHIPEGLFERFFGNVWFDDKPPDWFYWTSDIEADYTKYSGFSSEVIERWKIERDKRKELDRIRAREERTRVTERGGQGDA